MFVFDLGDGDLLGVFNLVGVGVLVGPVGVVFLDVFDDVVGEVEVVDVLLDVVVELFGGLVELLFLLEVFFLGLGGLVVLVVLF